MLIGHDKNKKYFRNVIKNGALSHAYIFSGPDMIGKKKFACELYKFLNDRESNIDPDFKLISPGFSSGSTKIQISGIRDLKLYLSLKPYHGPHKYVVIDDADRLTDQASNALLKTLEEPSASSVLVLVTSKPNYLLSTILSRCQSIKFLPQRDDEIINYLSDSYIKKDDLNILVRLAGGRLGWIINTLESGNLDNIKNSINEFETIIKNGIFERMQLVKKIYERGNYVESINHWIRWARTGDLRNSNILKNLMHLNQIISQPQYNHRLALENFLINI